MATPGQLVRTMANALGIPLETVTNYDRVLSESGMRSKSGRGRAAATVTSGDAANLLIAILGSPVAGASVKEAAKTCRTYGSLPVLMHERYIGTLAKVGLKMLDDLPKKHTLHDGISALINSAAKGETFLKGDAEPFTEYTMDLFCEIRLKGPRPWAEIIANMGERGKKFARLAYQDLKQSDKDLSYKDLGQERRVTYRTIRMLGSLLSESKPVSAGKV